jgi:hydrogenase assembly chaperone HypC/HupF
MCLTSVGRVVSVGESGTEAVVEVRGRARTVSLAALVLEGRAPVPGDHVRLHTGLAVEIIDEAAAADLDDLLDRVEGGS